MSDNGEIESGCGEQPFDILGPGAIRVDLGVVVFCIHTFTISPASDTD